MTYIGFFGNNEATIVRNYSQLVIVNGDHDGVLEANVDQVQHYVFSAFRLNDLAL